MLSKAQTPPDSSQAWKRFNGNNRLDGTSLAILKLLATWRDKQAEKRNLARGFVIKDNALMTIASKQPASLAELSELDVWHPKAVQRNGPALIALIDQVVKQGITAPAPASLKSEHRTLMNDMRNLVQQKATELSVDPAMLASRRELESLILLPENESLSERFLGWRKNIITDDLIAMKDAY